jgi:cell division protein FtsZ
MNPGKEREELAHKWREVLASIQDRMLRACLPTSADKIHLEKGVLVIEVDSGFKKRYAQRKAMKILAAAREILGATEIRVTELPLIEEMEKKEAPAPPANILVIGVGDGGINALERMREAGLSGVRLVAADTDSQVLSISRAQQKLQLGPDLTGGRGTGGDVDKGRRAAEVVAWEIESLVNGAHLVFLTCGLGGGTGTGATPVIAHLAREAGALTVGVVTLPFSFEGPVRMQRAQAGLERLKEEVDVIIVIQNDRLIEKASGVPLAQAFELADEVLRTGVQGISDLITVPGIVNLDFADVATVLRGAGTAMMGIGEGQGEARAVQAAKMAATNPLFEGESIRGARKVLLNITGGEDLTLAEVTQIAETIRKLIATDADLTFGAVVREEMSGRLKVTVIAADFKSALFEEEESSTPHGPSVPRVPRRRNMDQEDVDIPAFLRRKREE